MTPTRESEETKTAKLDRRMKAAKAFRHVRISLGITQKEAATQIGINRVTLGAFEDNMPEKVSEQKLLPFLEKRMGCNSMDDLIGMAENLSPKIDKYTVSLSCRLLCCEEKMTRHNLASLAGVHWSHFYRFLEGDITQVSLKRLQALPPIFGCDTLQEMINKAAGLAVHYKRETLPGMMPERMAAKLEISVEDLETFEKSGKGIAQGKINTFPKALACDSINKLLEEAIKIAPLKIRGYLEVVGLSRQAGSKQR